jgi:hypothetical protein
MVGSVMSNHKEELKVLFSKKVKEGEKLMTQRDQSVKWWKKLSFHVFDLAYFAPEKVHKEIQTQ